MHAMFIEMLSRQRGVSVLRRSGSAPVEYIHIELSDHDVIFAEGAAAETFVDDNSRKMFDNAAEFSLLYGANAVPPGFCAPRVDSGFQLEAVRRRLAGRAGLPTVAAAPGKLLGHVEHFENGVLHGWVMDESNPAVPVELEVLVDGDSVIRLVANGYRSDLDRAGFAGSRCAFSVAPTSVRNIGQIQAKRASDGMSLPIACVAGAGALPLRHGRVKYIRSCRHDVHRTMHAMVMKRERLRRTRIWTDRIAGSAKEIKGRSVEEPSAKRTGDAKLQSRWSRQTRPKARSRTPSAASKTRCGTR